MGKVRNSFIILISLLMPLSSSAIIGGKVVPKENHKEVLRLLRMGSLCTATLIGPNVILTAGHCARKGEDVRFQYNGKTYNAVGYPHPKAKGLPDYFDLSIGLVTSTVRNGEKTPIQEVKEASPLSVSSSASLNQKVQVMGFGAHEKIMYRTDGQLRIGENFIEKVKENYVLLSKSGAWLGMGDSGGPVLAEVNGRTEVVGVSTAQIAPEIEIEIKDPKTGKVRKRKAWEAYGINYAMSLAQKEIWDYLKDFTKTHNVEICGINKVCP